MKARDNHELAIGCRMVHKRVSLQQPGSSRKRWCKFMDAFAPPRAETVFPREMFHAALVLANGTVRR